VKRTAFVAMKMSFYHKRHIISMIIANCSTTVTFYYSALKRDGANTGGSEKTLLTP